MMPDTEAQRRGLGHRQGTRRIFSSAFVFIFLSCASLLVYWGSFSNQFIWDDYPYLVNNPSMSRLDGASIVSFFNDRSTTSDDAERLSRHVWRPLVRTSFAVDYRIWKLEPRPYHVENTVLHIVNTLLVRATVLAITADPLASFFAALLFAVHPAQTQAVTLVSGRANVLFLLFFLAAFLFYIRRQEGRSLAPALASFFCALLSKEMAIVLPLVLVLYELVFREERKKRWHSRALPFFVIAGAYVVARFAVTGALGQRPDWMAGSFVSALLTSAKALLGYVRILVLPVNLRIEYLVEAAVSPFAPSVMAALLFLAVTALVAWRASRPVRFFILWFFIGLLPVMNIVPINTIMDERFLYGPLIGFSALVGIALGAWAKRANGRPLAEIGFIAFSASLFIVLGAATVARNAELFDNASLDRAETKHAPENPRFHYNVALANARRALDEAGVKAASCPAYHVAVYEFGEAIRLNRSFQSAYAGLGSLYLSSGEYEKAKRVLRHALEVGGEESALVYNNIGTAYSMTGNYDDALDAYRESLRLRPGDGEVYVNIGNVYSGKGDEGRARRFWALAIAGGVRDASLERKIRRLEEKNR